MRKRPAPVRFIEKIRVDPETGCWLWTAATRSAQGYGSFVVRHGHTVQAHRYAYELLIGSIPDGMHLDHLCRTPACVNPEHLEPVPCHVNVRRGESIMATRASQTHCKRGHLLSGDNLYPRGERGRECRACWSVHRERRRRQQKVAA